MDDVENEVFMCFRRVAYRLGVPMAWLEREAKAGRIPHIKAGRSILMNVEQVERTLREVAKKNQCAKSCAKPEEGNSSNA